MSCSYCDRSFDFEDYRSPIDAMKAKEQHEVAVHMADIAINWDPESSECAGSESDTVEQAGYECEVCNRAFLICDYNNAKVAEKACNSHKRSAHNDSTASSSITVVSSYECGICSKNFLVNNYQSSNDAKTARDSHVKGVHK